jgi:acetyl-CoA synthetase (ADP-forming)
MALFNIFKNRKKKSKSTASTVKKVKKTVKAKVPKMKVKKKAKITKPVVRPKIKKIVKPVKISKVEAKPLTNKMPDDKAFELLKRYRIKVPDYEFCKKEEEAKNFLKKIGFPCVMKVSGRNIIHKTDVNGVKTNINTEEEAIKTFNELMKINGCEKVLVQKMIREGYELIIGGKKDPQFKKVIALGAGGIFTEFLKDVSFRVSPLTTEDAEDMLNEVKFSELILKGFRGQKPANKESIVNTILAVSRMIEADPKIKEVDLNPVFATSQDTIVADVRIILE